MRPGRLEVICGPMYSGKSEELMRRLRRNKIAGRKVILVKPRADDRYHSDHVVSHNGASMEAQACSVEDLMNVIEDADTVGIDEVQFYTEELIPVINTLVSNGKLVVVSGLDMTYRQEPFGIMPYLLSTAENVEKLAAICHKCGEDAYFTQRLDDGKPASFAGPTVSVGGLESYEARCRDCFEGKNG